MLIIVLFFVFAFITVFLSVKISYYADQLSNKYGLSNGLVGGILLAGVTSIPEFLTCFSSILIGNPTLILGDVFGSNLFNIVMISFFDILFLGKMFFINKKEKHVRIFLLLIISYLFVFLYMNNIVNFNLLTIGLPSMIILILYFYYLINLKNDDKNITKKVNKKIIFKVVIISILLSLSSILLTIIVNKISVIYSSFSASLIGAVLLGIVTSLPEVITFCTLIDLDNYDLALSNILGSNMFNFLVLVIGDIFLGKSIIYNFFDTKTIYIIIMGLVFTFISFLLNLRNKCFNKYSYIFISIFIVVLYFIFFIFNFIY